MAAKETKAPEKKVEEQAKETKAPEKKSKSSYIVNVVGFHSEGRMFRAGEKVETKQDKKYMEQWRKLKVIVR